MLVRPWESYVKAKIENHDNGSATFEITCPQTFNKLIFHVSLIYTLLLLSPLVLLPPLVTRASQILSRKLPLTNPSPVAVDLKDGSRSQDWLVKKKRKTAENKEELDFIKVGVKHFITPEEESALRELITEFQDIFAFKDDHIGSLSEQIEPPYRLRTVEHEP
jgi:hypothetical protein